MIFQDPMTSLNPVRTVGHQIIEPIELHLGLRGRGARTRAIDLLETVGIPSPERRIDDYPTSSPAACDSAS
jgi:ABC-type microcin C transport system duplicated ATPase subunit YejF